MCATVAHDHSDRGAMTEPITVDDVLDALPSRRGHFALESGYHTDLWITLDALFVDPRSIAPQVAVLAERLRAHAPTAICGPLFGGAFLAQALASQLAVKFFVMEPVAVASAADGPALFTARYRLPPGQVPHVRGQRVAVVDDVISAGSSVRAAIAALLDGGASVVAVGALLVLGDAALTHFAAQALPVERLGQRGLPLWHPDECALCRSGTPIERP
jgi:orotate phosphoribosyltransferase